MLIFSKDSIKCLAIYFEMKLSSQKHFSFSAHNAVYIRKAFYNFILKYKRENIQKCKTITSYGIT